MNFNEKLLESLEEEDRPLAKVILFFIKEQLNLYHFFNVKDGKLIITEDLYDDTQRITSKLLEAEILISDYPDGSLVRVTPVYNLYVTEGQEFNLDIDRLRSHFPTGQKSDKITITNMLREFFKKYPQYNMDDVEIAAKKYINHCKSIERPIRDANNFIEDSEGVSMLLQWLEESKSNKINVGDEFI